MPLWFQQQYAKPNKLKPIIERHLGRSLGTAESVIHELRPAERVNVERIIEKWAQEQSPAAQPIGYCAQQPYMFDDSFVKALMINQLIQAPVEREPLESGPDETFDGVARGFFLLNRPDTPIVVALRNVKFPSELPRLEIIAPNREIARASLSDLLAQSRKDSIYKGRTISLERLSSWREGVGIRFHSMRPANRNEIVLPEALLNVIERNVLGMVRHSATLKSAQRSMRRGMLFHGPPGTGKTMIIRYLATACHDHTVILLTNVQPGLIREACHIGRLLAPTIVVLEDVDMFAEDRQTNQTPVTLHELLNEMDGVGPRDEITFILTTNRPHVLEPALAARPGRVDQAIAFPLPDDAGRRKLFDVYGRGLDLTNVNIDQIVVQTAGVTPAFIEELLRKSALIAAERCEANSPLRLHDSDLREAMHELVFFGGELTQKLLGYRTSRIGYQGESGTGK